MNSMEQLLTFIERLREAKIQFTLDCQREAIMVTVPPRSPITKSSSSPTARSMCRDLPQSPSRK